MAKRIFNVVFSVLFVVCFFAAIYTEGAYKPNWWSLLIMLGGVVLGVWTLAFLSGAVVLKGAPWQFAFILAPLLIVLAWVFLQAQPIWPEGIAFPVWEDPLGAISPAPRATMDAFYRFATYIACFFVCWQVSANNEKLAMRALYFMVFMGVVSVILGFVLLMSGDLTLFLEKKNYYRGYLTGPLINRNMFAYYLAVSTVVTFGLLLMHIRRARRHFPKGKFWTVLPHMPQQDILVVSILAGSVLIEIVGLAMTGSRGGFSAAGLGLALLFLFGQRSASRWTVAVLLLGGVFFLVLADASSVGERIAKSGMFDDGREQIYSDLLRGIEASPWLGLGYGAFEHYFVLFKTSFISRLPIKEAHSSILESIAGLGIPFFLLMVTAAVAGIASFLKGIRGRRRHRTFPMIGLAFAGATIFHSSIDFVLNIPGLSWLVASYLGICLGQSLPTHDVRTYLTFPPRSEKPVSG